MISPCYNGIGRRVWPGMAIPYPPFSIPSLKPAPSTPPLLSGVEIARWRDGWHPKIPAFGSGSTAGQCLGAFPQSAANRFANPPETPPSPTCILGSPTTPSNAPTGFANLATENRPAPLTATCNLSLKISQENAQTNTPPVPSNRTGKTGNLRILGNLWAALPRATVRPTQRNLWHLVIKAVPPDFASRNERSLVIGFYFAPCAGPSGF